VAPPAVGGTIVDSVVSSTGHIAAKPTALPPVVDSAKTPEQIPETLAYQDAISVASVEEGATAAIASSDSTYHGANAASRWSSLVVRTIDCPADPRNLEIWGRSLGASVATLRSRCVALGTSTKSSLDFARVLRAVVRSIGSRWEPSIELDVYDPRTLRRLIEQGGLGAMGDGCVSSSLRRFLEGQQLIRHELALHYVERELAARGLEL
jgi:hypothetical protein